MTPRCTGIVDGRFPERCNLDTIQHVAFSYDGGYPYVNKTLNLNLAG